MKGTLLILTFLLAAIVLDAQTRYPTFAYRKAKDTTRYLRAVDEYSNKDYDRALKTLRKLSRRYTHDAAVHRLRGLCLEELGHVDEARRAMGLALAESPEAYGLLTERARLSLKVQNYRAQAADLCAYLLFEPDCIAAVYGYVHALRQLEEYNLGIGFLSVFPEKDAGLSNLLGHFYIQTERFDSAIAVLDRVVRTYPNYEPGYECLTMAYYYADQHELALNTADRLIKLNNQHAYAFALKAWIYDDLGQDAEAQEQYDIAEKLGYVFEPDPRF